MLLGIHKLRVLWDLPSAEPRSQFWLCPLVIVAYNTQSQCLWECHRVTESEWLYHRYHMQMLIFWSFLVPFADQCKTLSLVEVIISKHVTCFVVSSIFVSWILWLVVCMAVSLLYLTVGIYSETRLASSQVHLLESHQQYVEKEKHACSNTSGW